MGDDLLRRALVLGATVLLWGTALGPGLASAADESKTQATTDPAQVVPEFVAVPDVAARSEEFKAALRRSAERSKPESAVVGIEEELPGARSLVAEKAREVEVLLAAAPTLEDLADQERVWTTRSNQLGGWRRTLSARASQLETEVSDLEATRGLWQRSLERARESQAPREIEAAIRANIAEIEQALGQTRRRRSQVLTLLNQVSQPEAGASDVLAAIHSARRDLRASLFEPDSPPFWRATSAGEGEERVSKRIRDALATDARTLRDFLQEKQRSFLPVGAAFAATLLGVRALRERLRRRTEQSEHLTGSAAAFLFWLLRPSRLAKLPPDIHLPTALGLALRLALGLLLVASLANLFGYSAFSRVVGDGVLASIYLGVVVYAAYRVATTVLVVLLSSERIGALGVVRTRGTEICRGGMLLFAVAGVGGWPSPRRAWTSAASPSSREPLASASASASRTW